MAVMDPALRLRGRKGCGPGPPLCTCECGPSLGIGFPTRAAWGRLVPNCSGHCPWVGKGQGRQGFFSMETSPAQQRMSQQWCPVKRHQAGLRAWPTQERGPECVLVSHRLQSPSQGSALMPRGGGGRCRSSDRVTPPESHSWQGWDVYLGASDLRVLPLWSLSQCRCDIHGREVDG